MNVVRKVYFGEKYLQLAPDYAGREMQDKDAVFPANEAGMVEAINRLEHTTLEAAFIFSDDPESTWKLFCSQFQRIVAAGGLVKNEDGEILFIFRRGKWDLPKGKLDDGEDLAACALREVTEETGLSDLSITQFLGFTWHVYAEKGTPVLKESAWYGMLQNSPQPLVPQEEEDISEAKWSTAKDWPVILANTYPSIRDVMKLAGLI